MAPVSLPASSSPAWATLSLARPFTPPPGVTLWLSLAVNRGSAVMALADLATTAAGDVSAVRRIAPNGISHPLSAPALPWANPGLAPVLVDTAALALRVVGTPPDKAPIDVAVVDLDGGGATASSTAGSVVLSLTAPGPRTPLALAGVGDRRDDRDDRAGGGRLHRRSRSDERPSDRCVELGGNRVTSRSGREFPRFREDSRPDGAISSAGLSAQGMVHP